MHPSRPRSTDVWGFLFFSHGWTWVFWGVLVVTGWNPFAFPGIVFLVIGGVGPMLGGIVMSWLVGGRTELRDLGRRILDPRLVPARWWLVVVGLVPVITALAAVIAVGVTPTAQPVALGEARELFANPTALLLTAGFILVFGPLPEEIGWRGFLLDRLQLRWTALTASLLVGVAWLAWHAPLFAMAGYYAAVGGAPPLLPFATGIVVVSILYTWIHNNADRSVLAAILFHFVQNFVGQVFDLAPETRAIQAVLFVVVAAIVVIVWGPRQLRRSGLRPRPVTGRPPET